MLSCFGYLKFKNWLNDCHFKSNVLFSHASKFAISLTKDIFFDTLKINYYFAGKKIEKNLVAICVMCLQFTL